MTNLMADPRISAGLPASPPLSARLRSAEQAVNPLFESARTLLRALADTPAVLEPDAVMHRRLGLEQELRLFARVCSELKLRADHVVRASYSLCAALDEAAVQTRWGSGGATGVDWQSNSLAVALGHDRQGSDRVFRLIDEALARPREHLDLLELYQNILDLGFKGRYRFASDGAARLQSIREAVHQVVATGGFSNIPDNEPIRPSRHSIVDPWVRPVPVRRTRWWIGVGLAVALLLGAAGYAAVDLWMHGEPATMTSPLDALSERLGSSLRDEVAAGNVELHQDVATKVLTLRFNGMYASGDVTVAPWWASMMATVGRTIAASVPGAYVQVVGYTDNVPAGAISRRNNQALSEARAREVARIFAAAGVPVQNISVTGQGDADPLADNGTAPGRSRNRRVEVTVSN
ncbi:type IVB secretion system protein IcmH/DotU [Burkholderia cenocepacia]|uniref:type IVB secretion system protein IcmH/DotU n=1 Tax=Burkholderia cenocepacia TaxID=95486 RepID=UPI001CF0EF71|nr:type IVB secretion system protein IcmH/DotU [Burkholderia cenocepacia]MCA7921045.1 type IVB secretion system protein IcmH/DotU [Burkholderia cenocepacia]